MSTLDPVLARVGFPGPGVLEAVALLQHLERRTPSGEMPAAIDPRPLAVARGQCVTLRP